MVKCRICRRLLKDPFLSLGNAPLSNAFLRKEDLRGMEPYYPLDVFRCPACHLAQIGDFKPAEEIFSDQYHYFSSYSKSWLKHCEDYAGMASRRFRLNRKSFVVEIASNDGYLLQFFKQRDIPVLGIEPAANTAAIAIRKGIPTKTCFFNSTYARTMKASGKQADLIIGNNVLAHNPDLNDFVEGLRLALKPTGVASMEFPHLLKLIRGRQFDTIYHEHFSYFSFFSVMKLFVRHHLEIFDVDEIPTHGGSLRIYARHRGRSGSKTASSVKRLLRKEKTFGLYEPARYRHFADQVRRVKENLLLFFIREKKAGKAIVGYGAPAKGNTLLNYCGIRRDFMDYTVDRNPWKCGKFLPGTHIPIKSPEQIAKDKPDYVLILPWNIKDEVMDQLAFIRRWRGKFVIPIPKLEILR